MSKIISAVVGRGVRLVKNDFCSVFGSVLQKNCSFRFCFGFAELTMVSVISVQLGLYSSVDVDAIFRLHL